MVKQDRYQRAQKDSAWNPDHGSEETEYREESVSAYEEVELLRKAGNIKRPGAPI